MARKRVQKKAARKVDNQKHEIHIMLLGMVAVLAIVGLVLMFNARMTGKLSSSQMMPNPVIYGKADVCYNVGPACQNLEPRTANRQYLAPDGMLHVTCACPPSDPPMPPVEIKIPIE